MLAAFYNFRLWSLSGFDYYYESREVRALVLEATQRFNVAD